MKYFVLGISSIIGLAIIIPYFIPLKLLYVGQSPENRSLIYFIVLGTVVLFMFTRHFLRKFKLSKIYSVEINHIDRNISFKAIKNMNGKEENKTISFDSFKVDFEFNEHPLYGTQRKIIIYEKNKLYNVINLDLDGWNRSEYINEMLENVLKIDKEFVDKIESNYG